MRVHYNGPGSLQYLLKLVIWIGIYIFVTSIRVITEEKLELFRSPSFQNTILYCFGRYSLRTKCIIILRLSGQITLNRTITFQIYTHKIFIYISEKIIYLKVAKLKRNTYV